MTKIGGQKLLGSVSEFDRIDQLPIIEIVTSTSDQWLCCCLWKLCCMKYRQKQIERQIHSRSPNSKPLSLRFFKVLYFVPCGEVDARIIGRSSGNVIGIQIRVVDVVGAGRRIEIHTSVKG